MKFLLQTIFLLLSIVALNAQTKVKLSIDRKLQNDITLIAKKIIAENAKDVIIVVLNNNTSKLVAVNDLKKALNYRYEPGSTIKPITLSIALKNYIVTLHSCIDTHNGKIKIDGKHIIQDGMKFERLSPTDVIVYNSNVGIAQIAKNLSAKEFAKGLKKYGIYVENEKVLNNVLNRSVVAYGYGLYVTPIDMTKAYEMLLKTDATYGMRNILIEDVKRGKEKVANIKNVIVGGKSAVSYTVENSRYTDKYNYSFYGFVEDNKGNSYTIGVLLIKPRSKNIYKNLKQTMDIFKKVAKKALRYR